MCQVIRMWYLLPLQVSRVMAHGQGLDVEGKNHSWFSIPVREIKNIIRGKDIVFVEINAITFKRYQEWRKS